METGLTRRCNIQFASSPICALLSASHKSTPSQIDADLVVNRLSVTRMKNPTPAEVVREFWRLMSSNDFHSVASVLASEYVLEWPQTNELIRGAKAFAQVNSEYPANGPWEFQINSVVASESSVATDVSVTDGVQSARCISFFSVQAGKIIKQVEFWPEPYSPPLNRQHLVEKLR